MKYSLAAMLAVALICTTPPARADGFTQSPSCSKPYKPYQFDSEWEVEQFKDDVERFKRCIADFVEEQQEEAQNHNEAAEQAIEEWNRFVRTELN